MIFEVFSCINLPRTKDQGGAVIKGKFVMGKTLKFMSLFMVALVLVFGTGGEVDAKKKKKKIKLTDEENAMFERWNIKPKKRKGSFNRKKK